MPPIEHETQRIRPFLPEDAPGVVAVIRAAYRALGYAMDLAEFDRDLADITAFYQDSGGEFWVLDNGGDMAWNGGVGGGAGDAAGGVGAVAGCIGVLPADFERCELRRLYLLDPLRGRGWGRRLIETALKWCRRSGAREVFLWSDIRFETAREVYLRCGFSASQRTRAIDPVNPGSIERLFELEL